MGIKRYSNQIDEEVPFNKSAVSLLLVMYGARSPVQLSFFLYNVLNLIVEFNIIRPLFVDNIIFNIQAAI